MTVRDCLALLAATGKSQYWDTILVWWDLSHHKIEWILFICANLLFLILTIIRIDKISIHLLKWGTYFLKHLTCNLEHHNTNIHILFLLGFCLMCFGFSSGHGGSDGLHGYVPSLDYAVSDLVLIIYLLLWNGHFL